MIFCYIQKKKKSFERILQPSNMAERDRRIEELFHCGYTALEIVAFLTLRHNISISVRQLKRILKRLGLYRRAQENFNEIIEAIQHELAGSGRCLGYRAMWRRLLTGYHLTVRRDSVMNLLRIMDPNGVEVRRAHRLRRRTYHSMGPDFCIHIDGYDKLKPYGFPIHGAICGFSRRILWLNVGRSNNSPATVAGYYLSYVQEIQAAPRQIRVDAGTENVLIADMQEAFLLDKMDDDSPKPVLIGKSVANQRIERWWGHLRQSAGQFWINLFKDLIDAGLFDREDEVQLECLRMCFFRILQKELDTIKAEWNQHRIRPVHNSTCPAGKPDVLYYMPELFGCRSYQVPLDPEELQEAEEVVYRFEDIVDPEYREIFEDAMQANQLHMPSTVDEGLLLYAQLMDILK